MAHVRDPSLFSPDAPLSMRRAETPRPSPPAVLPRLQLAAFESSLDTASLDALEALSQAATPESLRELFEEEPSLREVALLRTCHRVELYCWGGSPGHAWAAIESRFRGGEGWRTHPESEAVEHLFRVAAGLESTAVGEREARDQVRAAAGTVLSRYPRPVLRPLFLRAAEAAEEALPRVPPGRSIAALAAARVLEEVAQPFPRVLVVGTGVVGREVAERLSWYGRLTVVYRTHPPDPDFLRATNARVAPWSSLAEEIELADVVVTAVKTEGRLVGAEILQRRHRPLVVVDLGLPRNVDPALAGDGRVRIVDLERLRGGTSSGPLPDVEGSIAEHARIAASELAAYGYEPWIDGYRRAAEEIRVALLGAARGSLSGLSDAEWASVVRLTRRLSSRLLDGPTEGLRAIPPGSEGDELRRWANEYLRLGRSQA